MSEAVANAGLMHHTADYTVQSLHARRYQIQGTVQEFAGGIRLACLYSAILVVVVLPCASGDSGFPVLVCIR